MPVQDLLAEGGITKQMNVGLIDKILVSLQRLLPARLIGNAVYHLSRIEIVWIKNALINGFSWLYDVNTGEAENPVPDGYQSFNHFFSRNLQEGARQFDTGPDNFLAPADGTIAQLGKAHEGLLIQAKGVEFSASDLLGDEQLAADLADASFATIYLAPYNYHRLHMPIDGELVQTLFIPGLLYSVNARTTAAVPGLYAINERLVCQFQSPAGPFAMVLVGAMNVASISTAWGGEIPSPKDYRIQRQHYSGSSAPMLKQGEYMGHFNMGSTVVMLGPENLSEWDSSLTTGDSIEVGSKLGSIVNKAL